MSVQQGRSITLVSTWRAYAGGPAADVPGTLTVTITPTEGGAAVVGPTSTGITHPATGTYVYTWDVPADQTIGAYVVTWEADSLTATEVIDVVTAISTTDYTTLERVRWSLNLASAFTADDEMIEMLISATSAWIDSYTGRTFGTGDSATAQYYSNRLGYGDGEYYIPTQDIASDVDLMVEASYDRTTYTDITSQVELWPLSRRAGWPATGVALLAGPIGAARYRVTAVPGWPAIPAPIAEAALIQTTRLYKRKDSPEGVLGSSDWSGVVRLTRVDPDVRALLAPYVIPPIG